MKPPKEPKSFRHPRIYTRTWYRDGTAGQYLGAASAEVIIIYPDGRAPERTRTNGADSFRIFEGARPCWFKQGTTPEQQVQTMKKFAWDIGFKRIFVGEIK